MLVNQHFRTPLNGYIYWYEDEVHPTSLNAPEKNLNFEYISQPNVLRIEKVKGAQESELVFQTGNDLKPKLNISIF